jgi:predicted dehydrogenase
MERLRIAVVGLGKMGLLHASILNVMPSVEVVALCDKSSLLLKFVKKLFKEAQVVDDVERLADLNLDSVYVTTPIPVHFPVVKTLYLKKVARNLFVEKTLASSWDKAKELCELAQSFGDVNMVGYMKRFAVTFSKAKNILNQGTLGEIVSFEAYAYSSDFSEIQKGSKISASRGGVLEDLGAHIIDLALWFFGDLEVDSAMLKSMVEESCEDSAHFRVGQSGLEGLFDVSWCMDNYRLPDFGLVIKGDKGILRANDDKVELKLNDGKSSMWYRHDLDDNVGFLLGAPEYYREDECFINSVLTGSKAEPSFSTASRVDYVIDQVKKKAGRND